jgi:hypothetical protein
MTETQKVSEADVRPKDLGVCNDIIVRLVPFTPSTYQ